MIKMVKAVSSLVAIVTVLSSVVYASNEAPTKLAVQEAYGKLPLYFVQNNGQLDGKVKFYEKGNGRSTFFTKDGIYLSLNRGQEKGLKPNANVPKELNTEARAQAELVKLAPLGANKKTEIVAEEMLEGKINYFTGNNPDKWKTNIPTYKAVVYKEVYKGIDMKFYGNNSQFEYDIIVKPGADPANVRLSYDGIKGLKVTGDGDLEIALTGGNIIQKKPIIYQEIDGKRVDVAGRFKILNRQSKIETTQFAYGFEVGAYDKNHSIVIDPVLVYSTYLGGSGNDVAYGIAVDSSGNIYISGQTNSVNFPTVTPIDPTLSGNNDIFVTKINSSGSSIVYSTYLGGDSADWSYNIAVDASGNAYITGGTTSINFPTATPLQGIYSGGTWDAFVTKIASSGNSLIYSTYLGGSGGDLGKDITVDIFGNAYITGFTSSSDFPTAVAMQGWLNGGGDVFVTKINESGSAFIYSTYMGGSDVDDGSGIVVDSAGNAYIAGATSSADFPTVAPIYGTYAGNQDFFVAKMNTSGSGLIYSTYLGGSGSESNSDIAIDANGNAYITGETSSTDFPTVSAIQGAYNGGSSDAFVSKVNASGNSLIYSTYLGGNNGDTPNGIAVDSYGNVFVTGETSSANFPTVYPIDGTLGGPPDGFVTKINSAGSAFSYSTYLGGSGWDWGRNIAVDSSGNAYVTGETYSTDFPTKSAVQSTYAGNGDAFVTKIVLNVTGCAQINGTPMVGTQVVLKQQGEQNQLAATNTNGCYEFYQTVSGKSFQVVIGGPTGAQNVTGCAQLNASPVTAAQVTLSQKGERAQTTTTNANGCYEFNQTVPSKSFQVTIDGPIVP